MQETAMQVAEPNDIIDILFPERSKYRTMGPVDCTWPEEKPVTIINLARPTNHDGEQLSVAIPVFAADTRQDLEKRFQVLAQLGDERFRENNRALQKAQEIDQNEKNQRAVAEAEQKRKLKAIRKGEPTETDSKE